MIRLEDASKDHVDINAVGREESVVRNASKLLLESRKEAGPTTPKRKYQRRKIGEIRSPSVDSRRNGFVREWIKKDEKRNVKY